MWIDITNHPIPKTHNKVSGQTFTMNGHLCRFIYELTKIDKIKINKKMFQDHTYYTQQSKKQYKQKVIHISNV